MSPEEKIRVVEGGMCMAWQARMRVPFAVDTRTAGPSAGGTYSRRWILVDDSSSNNMYPQRWGA